MIGTNATADEFFYCECTELRPKLLDKTQLEKEVLLKEMRNNHQVKRMGLAFSFLIPLESFVRIGNNETFPLFLLFRFLFHFCFVVWPLQSHRLSLESIKAAWDSRCRTW